MTISLVKMSIIIMSMDANPWWARVKVPSGGKMMLSLSSTPMFSGSFPLRAFPMRAISTPTKALRALPGSSS